jgi:predicted helicase
VQPLLEELCITVNDIDPALFATSSSGKRKYITDPIVHAYEPFLQQYDPAAREAAGVFYTPTEIVAHIIDGIEDLLVDSLGRQDGLLDEHATFLDPATGTGTFLLGLASAGAEAARVAGFPVDQMVKEVMTKRASAFELFPGPYTVAHQRLEATLKGFGATLTDRLPTYLADTLAAPESGTLGGSGFGLAGVEIKKERQKADEVKTAQDILVIFGNPPYERIRQSISGASSRSRHPPSSTSRTRHRSTSAPT